MSDMQKTLIDLSQTSLDKIAIVYGNQTISYQELWNAVNTLSKVLKDFGVKKGDFVAIHMSNSIDMVVSVLAILKCSAVVLPVNVDLPQERISYILYKSNPKIILFNDYVHLKINYKGIYALNVNYALLKRHYQTEYSILYNPKDLAYCIFTSGSSGIPKGVLLTYEGIVNHIKAKITLLNLTHESRLCLSFNIGFVASIWQILTPIFLGAQLYLYESTTIKKPYQFLQQLEKDKIHLVSMIPHSLYAYLQYIGTKHSKLALPYLNWIVLTGEKVDRVVIDTFFREYKHISLINAYGQTECSDDTFHYIIPKDVESDIPIGSPIPNVSYKILNENMEEIINSNKGELYISGLCLSRGYLNDDKLTTERFVSISNVLYYRTGDVVKCSENNIIYLGRADNQIKILGNRIEPEEIEKHLNQIEGIKQSVVTTLETKEMGKKLVVFYKSDINIQAKVFINYLSKKLPKYMIPSIYKRVENFKENHNGKIDRKRVWECVEYNDSTPNSLESTELTEIQKKALKIIYTCIGQDYFNSISLDMDFDSLGLDSITFITMVVALENEFGFEFEDEMLLTTNFPTVKALLKYVEEKSTC